MSGTDVPSLSEDIWILGFLHLQSFDVVIGSSEDGGYYMIGLRRQCLKEGMNMIYKLFQVGIL